MLNIPRNCQLSEQIKQEMTPKRKRKFFMIIQGVPKKTLFSGFLAITPLWKGLEIKVERCFKKFRKFSIK